MNATQAYKKIEKAASILAWGWLLNNLLGLIAIIVLIYFIWWKWQLGILGFLVLLFGIWLVNSVILPRLFKILNRPFAEMAKSGAVRLAVLKVINDSTVERLSQTKVEYWPRVITESMTEKQFREKILLQ